MVLFSIYLIIIIYIFTHDYNYFILVNKANWTEMWMGKLRNKGSISDSLALVLKSITLKLNIW